MSLLKWVIQDLFSCLHVAVLCAVLSSLLSSWPGVKDCSCLCETGKALGDSGMKVGTVRLWWAQGSWGPWENMALRKGAHLTAESEQSRGPSSLLHTGGCLSGQSGALERYRSARGKSSFGQHFTSLREHQPTTIHVPCCQHMKNSNEFQRLEVCQWGNSAAH